MSKDKVRRWRMKDVRTMGFAVLAMLRQLRDPILRLKGGRDDGLDCKFELGRGMGIGLIFIDLGIIMIILIIVV